MYIIQANWFHVHIHIMNSDRRNESSGYHIKIQHGTIQYIMEHCQCTMVHC